MEWMFLAVVAIGCALLLALMVEWISPESPGK